MIRSLDSSQNSCGLSFGTQKHGERNQSQTMKKKNNLLQPMEIHLILAMEICIQFVREHLTQQHQILRQLCQLLRCQRVDCLDFSLLGDQLVQVIFYIHDVHNVDMICFVYLQVYYFSIDIL